MLKDDLNCITTLSCDFIPSPPLGGERQVIERTDFFFADDDFLLWPQPYNPALPHLPYIHCREPDIYENNRSFLWDLPNHDNDFVRSSTDICTGLGRLSSSVLAELTAFEHSLLDRVGQLRITFRGYIDNSLLTRLLFEARALFSRLELLEMGYHSLCRTVRAVQRNLLEIEAYLDYTVLSLDPVEPAGPGCRATVGAYVSAIHDVQSFSHKGIRHWLIRPSELVLRCPIREVVLMRHPQDLGFSLDPLPGATPVFTGSAGDLNKYKAVKHFGRSCIRFPDPFHCNSLPQARRSNAGAIRSLNLSHRSLTQKQRQKKFSSDRKSVSFRFPTHNRIQMGDVVTTSFLVANSRIRSAHTIRSPFDIGVKLNLMLTPSLKTSGSSSTILMPDMSYLSLRSWSQRKLQRSQNECSAPG